MVEPEHRVNTPVICACRRKEFYRIAMSLSELRPVFGICPECDTYNTEKGQAKP